MEKSIVSRKYRVFLDLLVETRKGKKVTQVALAKKLKTDQSTVSKMERGERRIDVIELRSICWAIKVPLVDFVAEMEERLKSRGSRKKSR